MSGNSRKNQNKGVWFVICMHTEKESEESERERERS